MTMTNSSRRSFYEQRRPVRRQSNNSLRRTYDLLRVTVPRLEPGTPLVEQQLVDDLSASRNTVRLALQALASEGLVSRGSKVGTRVLPSSVLPLSEITTPADLGATDVCNRLLECKVIQAPALIAQRLDIPERSPLAVIEAVRLEGGVPVAVITNYVAWEPHTRTPPGLDDADIVDYLERQVDVRIGESETHAAALACDAETAKLLEIEEGEPVLFIEDLLRDVEGRPLAIFHGRWGGSRVTMYTTSRRRRVDFAGHRSAGAGTLVEFPSVSCGERLGGFASAANDGRDRPAVDAGVDRLV
jgi:GntR family transcriptional regulator